MAAVFLDAALILFAGAMAWAAVSDLLTMTIPNRISIGLVALFLLAAPAAGMPLSAFGMHWAVGLATLAVTFILFSLGVFGGGDAKLIAAAALWMGPAGILEFVFLTAVYGGALALLFLLLRRLPVPAAAARVPWTARLLEPAGGIPYGIAIAAAAIVRLPVIGC